MVRVASVAKRIKIANPESKDQNEKARIGGGKS